MFTNEVLSQSELSLRDLKERILKADRIKSLDASENHPSLKFALRIAKENAWMKFWDAALTMVLMAPGHPYHFSNYSV